MNLHGPLAISTQYDLRIRTVARCLVQQICSRLGSSRVTTHQIASNGSGIVYSLHGDIVCSDQLVEMVEERRANKRANVAELDGAPCENDSDRLASDPGDISELVALDIPIVLPSGDGSAGGARLFEASIKGEVDRYGASG